MKIPMGVSYAILAAMLFGSTTPVAKFIIRDIHPVILAAILYLGSGVGLFLTRWITGSRSREAALQRSSMPWLLGAILFGGILAPVLLMAGLKLTPASSASLLLNLEGVFTALIAWVTFRENFDRRIAIGMAFIVVGGIVLTCQGEARMELSWGAVLIVLACICWGLDNNFTQKVSSSDPYQVASIKGLVAGIFNLAVSASLGAAHCPLAHALWGLLLGFFGYGLSLAFFVISLRHIGTARTGAYFSFAPFWGTILSILILNEPITGNLLTAGILMAIGLWLHLTESHAHQHLHDEFVHDHKHEHDEHHQHAHDGSGEASDTHSHPHRHEKINHSHVHFPDIHHRHSH